MGASELGGSKHADSKHWWLLFGIIVSLSFATRFYKVTEPDHVCWDETHFGKMSGWYINRTLFFDVHPPLGKMLIGLSGYLSGYDAKFPFNKPGEKFEEAKYIGMRVFCTLLGTMVVPFSFIIVWEMTRSLVTASLSSSLLLLDVGLLTISQYILLDPILFFFMMGAVMGVSKFNSARDKAFSQSWWAWLVFTGAMLACTIAVKFVGLFVVLYVGLHTITDLWNMIGDLKTPVQQTIQHFLTRVIGLIVVPVIVYVSIFYVHLAVLNNSGPGDALYSSEFQSTLIGNSMNNISMPRDVAYGSVITLKNHRTGGGYLHSHVELYPLGIGAPQQQVTSFGAKDHNNEFRVRKHFTRSLNLSELIDDDEDIELVRNGDLMVLEHVFTEKHLHSHQHPAPIHKKNFQVTGYGTNGTGDEYDVWRLEFVNGEPGEVLTVVNHKFRLVHNVLGCVLTAINDAKLPLWGFLQGEVSCTPNLRDAHAIWNVEGHVFSKLPNVSFDIFAPSFFRKFAEAHELMIKSNAGLKLKEGEQMHTPWQWPFNHKGLYFSGEETFRVYLLGNPIVWWGNLVFLVLFFVVFTYNAVREQRGYPDPPFLRERKERMTTTCGWLLVGWALHYIPFYTMGRILYYHHYFPALLFSSMLTGVVLNYLLENLQQYFPAKVGSRVYGWSLAAVVSIVVYSFYLFSPLAYGMHGPGASLSNSTYHSIKWLNSWEF